MFNSGITTNKGYFSNRINNIKLTNSNICKNIIPSSYNPILNKMISETKINNKFNFNFENHNEASLKLNFPNEIKTEEETKYECKNEFDNVDIKNENYDCSNKNSDQIKDYSEYNAPEINSPKDKKAKSNYNLNNIQHNEEEKDLSSKLRDLFNDNEGRISVSSTSRCNFENLSKFENIYPWLVFFKTKLEDKNKNKLSNENFLRKFYDYMDLTAIDRKNNFFVCQINSIFTQDYNLVVEGSDLKGSFCLIYFDCLKSDTSNFVVGALLVVKKEKKLKSYNLIKEVIESVFYINSKDQFYLV